MLSSLSMSHCIVWTLSLEGRNKCSSVCLCWGGNIKEELTLTPVQILKQQMGWNDKELHIINSAAERRTVEFHLSCSLSILLMNCKRLLEVGFVDPQAAIVLDDWGNVLIDHCGLFWLFNYSLGVMLCILQRVEIHYYWYSTEYRLVLYPYVSVCIHTKSVCMHTYNTYKSYRHTLYTCICPCLCTFVDIQLYEVWREWSVCHIHSIHLPSCWCSWGISSMKTIQNLDLTQVPQQSHIEGPVHFWK